jgi:hypothetical protein
MYPGMAATGRAHGLHAGRLSRGLDVTQPDERLGGFKSSDVLRQAHLGRKIEETWLAIHRFTSCGFTARLPQSN